eukprot:TRINITY_DN1330_c0_g1_i9.p3 TRINITY_DN1330_c0_g1~~TRINITY_DN1330_c0_g1_i9.p3  ORF type:complete len:107 (+),score=27.06 TRINITY_DN1330_c0_g1_i9:196-516(+)
MCIRDRYLLEKAHPGCGLLSKFRPRVPGLDSLLMMLVSALQDPNERVESLRWTIVEHFSLFGMHEAWQASPDSHHHRPTLALRPGIAPNPHQTNPDPHRPCRRQTR